MINYKKYNLSDDNINFLLEVEECCINGQNEIILKYKDKSFVVEPHGKAVQVYAYGEILGNYESFEDFILNYKVDGVPLIEIVNELEYGE